MEELDNGIINEERPEPVAAMEDMVPKERVTELIKREKEAAYRKAHRENEQSRTGQTQQMGGMSQSPQIDVEDVYRQVTDRLRGEYEKAQQESQKQQYEDFVKGQVESYVKKMDGANSLADDFKEMTSKFKPEKFREVFYLANSVENTPQVVYELSKNPQKLAMIDYLAKTDPDLAKDQLEALSKSIMANEQALASNVSTNPPLSRPKPSLAAGADSGSMGIRDFKKAPWLRG